MTAATMIDANTEAAESWPLCWECGGPCLTYKGTVHGWRCTVCIERYLDAGERAWQARSEKAKERINRNLLHSNTSQTPVTADRRRGGGAPSCVPTTAPASTDGDRSPERAPTTERGIHR
ncbi:hypothetical protein MINTM019_20670 [Mycobacterium paraintracellulare]|nr:hypothetical protein MINTM019_20670 [Mycobacterium paraintracellulare]